MAAVTYSQVAEMVDALPLHDQQRIVQRIGDRLATQQEYFVVAAAFLKHCLENPIRPESSASLDGQKLLDSGKEIADMREERGDQLL